MTGTGSFLYYSLISAGTIFLEGAVSSYPILTDSPFIIMLILLTHCFIT